jgi:hypothetical protein
MDMPLDDITTAIGDLPMGAQRRVCQIAERLRTATRTDANFETELAMLLVLEELNTARETDASHPVH